MKTKQDIIAYIKQVLDYPIDMDEQQILIENSVAYAKMILGRIRSMFPNAEAQRLVDVLEAKLVLY